MRPWLIAGIGVLLLGLAILGGVLWYRSAYPTAEGPIKSEGTSALDQVGTETGVATVDLPVDQDPSRGATPMKDRVAVLGLLNKRNGASRDLTLKPGQATRIGDVVVRLRACEQTAPWEAEHYTGAFVQLDVQQVDKTWRRVFSGWLFKERPSLNAVQNQIYDVWPKSCAMSFPQTGPDTVVASAPVRSSAKKSASPAAAADAVDNGPAPAPAPVLPNPAKAEPSNPR